MPSALLRAVVAAVTISERSSPATLSAAFKAALADADVAVGGGWWVV
jgi:hypothetical protein